MQLCEETPTKQLPAVHRQAVGKKGVVGSPGDMANGPKGRLAPKADRKERKRRRAVLFRAEPLPNPRGSVPRGGREKRCSSTFRRLLSRQRGAANKATPWQKPHAYREKPVQKGRRPRQDERERSERHARERESLITRKERKSS